MNNQIKLLDNGTINKIAAGEVIERPASVIKELIENSIDALSSFITIEIKDGGKSYIRVTDNGIGISPKYIELAFLRHSTSKINGVDDLQSLSTLGFRGEALPSIASVSQLDLITRTKDNIGGVRISINGGQIIEKNEIGCPIGTTIILKNLFFNVPVRQKFLKSDAAEASNVSDIVYKLALGNPGIKFKFIKDNKVILNTPGNEDIKSTAYSLLGKEFVSSMFDIEYSGDDIKINGLVCKPSFTRGNRNHQYTYVNGRYIKNEDITEIIEDLYKTLIPINRFPVYIIYINISPELIDVNVHPTKTEIRFSNKEALKKILSNAIKSTFFNNTLIPTVTLPTKNKTEDNLQEKQESFLDSVNVEKTQIYQQEQYLHDIERKPSCKHNKSISENVDVDASSIIRILDLSVNETEESLYYENSDRDEAVENNTSIPELRIIGTLFDTYILAEDKINKNLYMIDQHAAHERIMYEKIKHRLELDKVYMQQLITPQIINMSHGEMQLFKENINIFMKLGFDIEEFGFNSVAIRSVPLVFGVPDAKNLFLDILDNLMDEIKTSYDIRLDKIMKMACSSAIKAGYNMKEVEIDILLNDLRNADQPYTCPHGRPVIIKISKYEIEKRFKRVQ